MSGVTRRVICSPVWRVSVVTNPLRGREVAARVHDQRRYPMRRHLAILITAVALAAVSVGSAAAAQPSNPNCWGVVSAQRATSVGDVGEHASAQSTPRLGLGNTARLLFEL